MHPSRLGGLLPAKSQQNSLPALDGSHNERRGRKSRVVLVVTIVRVGKELDDDNLQGACKGLRDAVAKSLAVDDRDKRVRWEYGQVQSGGRKGCIVKFELL